MQYLWWARLVLLAVFTLLEFGAALAQSGLIAYASTQGDTTAIYTVRPDGSGINRVIMNGRDPSFAPDGRILFVRGADLYTVKQDGSDVTQLTHHGLGVTISNPVMSLDNSIILFNSAPVVPNPVTSVRLFNTDGSGERTIATPGMDPAFTPDQVQVIYAANEAIYGMSRSSMGGRPYTPHVMYTPVSALTVRYPVYGPGDNNGFIFAGMPATAGAAWNLYAVHYGEQGPRQSVLVANANQPAFSTDGRNIAFIRNGELYLMNADGSNQRCMVHNGEISHPAWWDSTPQ